MSRDSLAWWITSEYFHPTSQSWLDQSETWLKLKTTGHGGAHNNKLSKKWNKKHLAQYCPERQTRVSADASFFGLEGVLSQLQPTWVWRPVAFISRSMTPAEKRYAQIGKEALAITWACERFQTYPLGLDFVVRTDHKPLVSLLGSRPLDDLPPRILRFRLRLLRFSYKIMHIAGKNDHSRHTF